MFCVSVNRIVIYFLHKRITLSALPAARAQTMRVLCATPVVQVGCAYFRGFCTGIFVVVCIR